MIKLSECIGKSFYNLHNDVINDRYTHYWLRGGRGSTKSSFISIEIILGIMQNENTNAVAIRKVKDTLKDSVYNQLQWAIEKLGVDRYWQATRAPMELIYTPTGQKVLFRGADDPRKLKSTKVSKGYIKYIWYEEVDEFYGQEEIDVINQSLLRGGDIFSVFYSYNPPKSVSSWTNRVTENENTVVHRSTYLTAPRAWIGEQFIIEAEHLLKVSPERYKNEYLGHATGTGGEVFGNIVAETITDDQIEEFEVFNRGIDWGYASDPFVYTVNHYDKKKRRLYIFYEFYKVGASFDSIYDAIEKQNTENGRIYADNEPRSNAELRGRGLRVERAAKGAGSRNHGFKWLQDLEAIIIDPARCPNAYREFTTYELTKDKTGNWREEYPDHNDHTIDATRYSLERYIRGARFKTRKALEDERK